MWTTSAATNWLIYKLFKFTCVVGLNCLLALTGDIVIVHVCWLTGLTCQWATASVPAVTHRASNTDISVFKKINTSIDSSINEWNLTSGRGIDTLQVYRCDLRQWHTASVLAVTHCKCTSVSLQVYWQWHTYGSDTLQVYWQWQTASVPVCHCKCTDSDILTAVTHCKCTGVSLQVYWQWHTSAVTHCKCTDSDTLTAVTHCKCTDSDTLQVYRCVTASVLTVTDCKCTGVSLQVYRQWHTYGGDTLQVYWQWQTASCPVCTASVLAVTYLRQWHTASVLTVTHCKCTGSDLAECSGSAPRQLCVQCAEPGCNQSVIILDMERVGQALRTLFLFFLLLLPKTLSTGNQSQLNFMWAFVTMLPIRLLSRILKLFRD